MMPVADSTPPRSTPASRLRHWHANLRWIAVLLLLGCGVTFGVSFYARDLNFVFLGWPFSFWMAAQGAPLVYGLIVWAYERRMARLDALHGVDEPED